MYTRDEIFMKRLKVKHDKLLLAFLIIILILAVLCYAYIFYASYARDEFFRNSLQIANQNQNSVFRISRILLYNSADAIDNSSNQSLQNLSICQYSDIAITIDNTSYISDLTTTNTVKEMYIDNIQVTMNSTDGTSYLNYKNLNDFGKFSVLNVPENRRIDFNIINTNEQNETADYSAPTFYTDCSNPISLGFVHRDIVQNFSVNDQVNSLVFNGQLLKQASVNLSDISYVLTFDINIKNYDDDNFIYHATLDTDLTSSDNTLYNGYLYQLKNDTSGSEYDFFKEVD